MNVTEKSTYADCTLITLIDRTQLIHSRKSITLQYIKNVLQQVSRKLK